MKKKFFLAIISFGIPIMSFATTASSNFGNFKEFVSWVIRAMINPTIAVLITAAVAFFFWGVVRYILSKESQSERDKGVKLMTRGIFALFIIITFWGFAQMLVRTFLG